MFEDEFTTEEDETLQILKYEQTEGHCYVDNLLIRSLICLKC